MGDYNSTKLQHKQGRRQKQLGVDRNKSPDRRESLTLGTPWRKQILRKASAQ